MPQRRAGPAHWLSRLSACGLLLALTLLAHGATAEPEVASEREHELLHEDGGLLSEDTGRQLLQDDEAGAWVYLTGVLVFRTVSMASGDDAMAYLLRMDNNSLVELDPSLVIRQMDQMRPGARVKVMVEVPLIPQAASIKRVLQFWVAQPSAVVGTDLGERGYASSGGYGDSLTDTGSGGSDSTGTQYVPPGAAQLAADLVGGAPWVQTTTVTDMPTLFMIAGMCNSPPAVAQADLEKVLFNIPGARAKTLEAYYTECSQGKAKMNYNNSRVVGPVTIPCDYSDADMSFTAQNCQYSDADGWIRYASKQAETLYGVDLTLYRHRVLIMPMYYIYDAGCPWVGLGTLGPDVTASDGSYLYSSVWITGEYWRQVMAYMHELGHTNYLHHAAQDRCEYCDASCAMGGCCDTRCFNPAHNWQLGWGKPIAVLNNASFPTGTFLQFDMPIQQSTDTNMLLIVPDWLTPVTRASSRAYAWFIGYRTDTGKYDDDIPGDYLYATNVYWWDGGLQTNTRVTRLFASVGSGREYRNTTSGIVVRQLEGRIDGAKIAVCRWSEARESSCGDGLDNDCDGLIDAADPDCAIAASGTPFPPTLSTPPSPPRPPTPVSPPPPPPPGLPPPVPWPPAMPPNAPGTPPPSPRPPPPKRSPPPLRSPPPSPGPPPPSPCPAPPTSPDAPSPPDSPEPIELAPTDALPPPPPHPKPPNKKPRPPPHPKPPSKKPPPPPHPKPPNKKPRPPPKQPKPPPKPPKPPPPKPPKPPKKPKMPPPSPKKAWQNKKLPPPPPKGRVSKLEMAGPLADAGAPLSDFFAELHVQAHMMDHGHLGDEPRIARWHDIFGGEPSTDDGADLPSRAHSADELAAEAELEDDSDDSVTSEREEGEGQRRMAAEQGEEEGIDFAALEQRLAAQAAAAEEAEVLAELSEAEEEEEAEEGAEGGHGEVGAGQAGGVQDQAHHAHAGAVVGEEGGRVLQGEEEEEEKDGGSKYTEEHWDRQLGAGMDGEGGGVTRGDPVRHGLGAERVTDVSEEELWSHIRDPHRSQADPVTHHHRSLSTSEDQSESEVDDAYRPRTAALDEIRHAAAASVDRWAKATQAGFETARRIAREQAAAAAAAASATVDALGQAAAAAQLHAGTTGRHMVHGHHSRTYGHAAAGETHAQHGHHHHAHQHHARQRVLHDDGLRFRFKLDRTADTEEAHDGEQEQQASHTDML